MQNGFQFCADVAAGTDATAAAALKLYEMGVFDAFDLIPFFTGVLVELI